ncbi:hypothetical protein CCHR01_05510 [Colletotrichum chrysophilum]|uniref:DUF7587 domain-containing protein n=1 Tax=Colletotrichum chrysophilum TaxID=1836956 RepID=A0AAD9ASA5_9PEZI|nr:hypothetical protein CCHR01_05510 [Colletotrichum chrysophilum]
MEPRPTVFKTTKPGWSRRLSVGFSRTPRYLFRVYDANSRGITSTSVVSSSYWSHHTSSCEKDLFSGRFRFGIMELYDHLKWFKMRDCDSNLVSWTSSLLFAIQLGLYKHSTRPVSKNENDLSKIFVLMIDTTKFPRGTFIRDRDAMEFFRDTSSSWTSDFEALYQTRTETDFYSGEYLSQGQFSVKGNCSQTSLQKLIDHGLFRFCPYFIEKRHWAALASRVVEIRREHFNDELPTRCFRRNERTVGRGAVVMAQSCLGEKFALPFALMILALSPIKKVSRVLFSAITGMFSEKELDCILPQNLMIDIKDLIEVNDFDGFVYELNNFRQYAWATDPADNDCRLLRAIILATPMLRTLIVFHALSWAGELCGHGTKNRQREKRASLMF